MKKLLAIFLLASMTLFSSLINSCGKDSCGRNYKGGSLFYATELYGRVYDQEFQSEKITDTTIIQYDLLNISLRFSGKKYSEAIRNFSFIPTAYACEPSEDESKEKLTDITIIANQDFDDLHPAGTSLNDVFYVSRLYRSSKFTVEEYLETHPNVQNLEFSLISAPDVQKQIQFTITYEFDGKLVKVLKYETPTFILSPN